MYVHTERGVMMKDKVETKVNRTKFFIFRLNEPEDDLLKEYAKLCDVGIREYGTFYRHLLIATARKAIKEKAGIK
jgi:hypothetical protein